MQWFTSNREIIKNLALNTGTSTQTEWTEMCTTTEISFNTELEQQDFYVFCDALQRSIVTGVAMSMDTTIKLDINNKAIEQLIGKVHALLTDGTIAQFNNQTIQFELLTNVEGGTLTYTKYQVPCILNFGELGGAAEDASEFSLNIVITGKGTVVSG